MKFGLAFIRSENDEQEKEAFSKAAEEIMRLPNFQKILSLPGIACDDQVVGILSHAFPSTVFDHWIKDIKSNLSESALQMMTDEMILHNLMGWIEDEVFKEIMMKMGSDTNLN